MFVTTFYSFKGGVGRSLALANVAAFLAKHGKKVLVVDFDLEAPGLQTLDLFAPAQNHEGLLDFVSAYVATGQVPEFSKYVVSCSFSEGESSHTIDILPAGSDSENYAGRFAALDWGKLYSEQNGFLLMEDLRVQWAVHGYDYVLVDSRTGHTDIGGICTRQLPDLLVAVFFPNEQNLTGLAQVIHDVRGKGARDKPIQTIFVASRVPKLDDEHGLLRKWLDRFQSQLGYHQSDLTMVEQYDSLSLLDQAVFVLKRPRSGLAKQYTLLGEHIRRSNSGDATGAISYLRSLSRSTFDLALARSSQIDEQTEDVDKRLTLISSLHPTDYLVQYELAVVYNQRRSIFDALISCDRAVQNFGSTKADLSFAPVSRSTLHRLRLRVCREIGLDEEALVSAKEILTQPDAPEGAVVDALLALTNDSSNASKVDLDSFAAIQGLGSQELTRVGKKVFNALHAVQTSARLIELAFKKQPNWRMSSDELVDSQLSLIASGRFSLAVHITDSAVEDWSKDLASSFNYAVARWGADGEPSIELFANLVPLFEEYRQSMMPNVLECGALTYAVLNNIETAREFITLADSAITTRGGREFSCWTYSNVDANEFRAHLHNLRLFAEDRRPLPEVLRRVSDVVEPSLL